MVMKSAWRCYEQLGQCEIPGKIIVAAIAGVTSHAGSCTVGCSSSVILAATSWCLVSTRKSFLAPSRAMRLPCTIVHPKALIIALRVLPEAKALASDCQAVTSLAYIGDMSMYLALKSF